MSSKPTFLGVGSVRGGSTWLHELLKSHPQIYVPTKRKEIDFFSLNYEKGEEWYCSFFDSVNVKHKAVGEISPRYLIDPEAPKRVSEFGSIEKLVGILRSPAHRAYSQYGQAVRLQGYSQSFEQYLEDFPLALEHGLYAKYINRWLELFELAQTKFLIFEEDLKDYDNVQRKLADFFQVDPFKFPDLSIGKKINQTYLPKYKKLNQIANRLRNYLVDQEITWAVNSFKQLGAQKILSAGASSLPPIPGIMLEKLTEFYYDDVSELEKLLDRDLSIWKIPSRVIR